MSTERRTRAWIEVHGDDLRRNLERIRASVGEDVGMIPMVKADAYGLGVARAVGALEPVRPLAYGVATVEEGRELRDLGVTRPVLVFTPVPPGLYRAAVEADLTLCLSELAALDRLREAVRTTGVEASFHVEVDTGMGRSGFGWREAGEWGPLVRESVGAGLGLGGCFTHFHSADVAEVGSVRSQWERFQDVLRALGPLPGEALVHACNSAAALRCPEYAADAVRPGIFLYGAVAGEELPAPEPVMAVRARVLFVRDAPPGSTVGYGATHAARGWERWATVGIGYGDGLPRRLGNRGHVLVSGRRAPIVGRISMDVIVVDISEIPGVGVGDVATVVGRDGDQTITLEEVAAWADTINYEILTGFSRRLPRIWIDRGDG